MAVIRSYNNHNLIDKENCKFHASHKCFAKSSKPDKADCCPCPTFSGICLKILAIILCVIVIVIALAEIIVSVVNGLATKLYSEELSGRLVGMIVLAVSAAITLVVTMFAIVGLVKKQKKTMHVVGAVVLVMAVIQALLCGIAVKVSSLDEVTLSNSLDQSFTQSLGGDQRHTKIWHGTQSTFQCCGLNGPQDYKDMSSIDWALPPQVPISCCKSYDSTKTPFGQEKERNACMAVKEYYPVGCRSLVQAAFRNSSSLVMSTSIVFIAFEVLLVLCCYLAYRRFRKRDKEQFGECNEVHVRSATTDLGQQHQDTQEVQLNTVESPTKS